MPDGTTKDGTAGKSKHTAPPKPQINDINFVTFDGSSNEANKKAVRKQAALSSAAARKATIAKKIAKQRSEQDGGQRKDDEKGTQEKTSKRKRSPEAAGSRKVGAWQHGLIVEMSELCPPVKSDSRQSRTPVAHSTVSARTPSCGPSMGELVERADSSANTAPSPTASTTSLSRQFARIIPAYMSPSQTSAEASTGQLSRRASTSSWSVAGTHDDDDVEDIPRRGNWPVMAGDFRAYEDRSSVPLTPESIASPKTRSASFIDPFNQWPVEYHPMYDRLLYHMMNVYSPAGWPALGITHHEGKRWEAFMTQHALAEPALFLVRVLYASGDLVVKKLLDPKVSIHLRHLAIKAINEAVSDEKRKISDGLILAVGRIALREALYGDETIAHTMHRPAQRQMIALRGGLNALPFPPLVKQLMRWADKVMSVQGGTSRMLPDDEDVGNATYTMDESVKVLDSWAPKAAQAVRKKIAITDLIT